MKILRSDLCKVVQRQRAAVITFFFCWASLQISAEIPIIAFGGVPAHESTAERFKEFREAGFDVSIENYWDVQPQQLSNILDIAHNESVRIMLKSRLLTEHPEKVAPYIKGHPALFGYYIEDEPYPATMNKTIDLYNKVRKADTTTRCYINLLPTYGIERDPNEQSSTYNDYLRQASRMNLPQISFDHYPIRDEGIRPDWYRNLEAVRRESLRTKKPFWAFVLCTPHVYYPQPTLASLRLQIYSNLAYGAQAIQYFTYWTPKPDDDYNYHDGPISLDGNRTKTYNLVKKMNLELRKILPLFDGAKVESVSHLLNIPNGTTKANKLPLNITKIKVKGKKGCILSTFKNGQHHYLAIVNKDHLSPITLTIGTRKGVVMIDKSLQERVPSSSYQVSGGDMLLFRLS